MGLFTSKIAIGVLAGGFTLAGAGLLFNGSETLQNATNWAKEAGQKITQYESNETALMDKFNTLKTNANTNIDVANQTIEGKKAEINKLQGQVDDLNSQKANLESQINDLGTQIASLKDDLAKSNGDLEATKNALSEKTAQYDAKVAELDKANKTIVDLTKLLAYAKDKTVEADKYVAQLEGELQKANDEVRAMGEEVAKVKEQTKNDQPLASGDVDAIDTTVNDVNTK